MKNIIFTLLLLIAGWQSTSFRRMPFSSWISDIEVNLDDKEAAWQFIVEKYGKTAKE